MCRCSAANVVQVFGRRLLVGVAGLEEQTPLRAATLTVLSEMDDMPQMDITAVLRDITDSVSIGHTRVTVANEVVPEDKLRAELLAIGNDGTFFDVEG